MIPQQTPIEKKPFLTVSGILLVLFYSFQNFIPGIGSLSRGVSYTIVALVFLAAAAVFWPELKRDVPAFFKHFKDYCVFFFPKFGIFLLIYFVTAVFITAAAGEASANQTALSGFPLPLLAFSALIYAPVLEEIIYRGFMRRLFSGDEMFILVSAFFFGLIHMLHPGQSFGQMLYILEYALLGGFLAYLYAKSDNICVSMLGHFFLNFVAFLPMLFA